MAVPLIVYPLVIRSQGVGSFGVWSLVLAITSVTRVTEFGLGGAITKFVASRDVKCQAREVGEVVASGLYPVAFLSPLVICLLYPLLRMILGRVVASADLELALELLPFALISLWLSLVASALQAALDGLNRIDMRAMVNVAGLIVFLLVALLSLGRFGLIGLALAQIAQAGFALGASAWALKREQPSIKWGVTSFRYRQLRSMSTYGASFQGAALLAMLVEPATKVLLSGLAGVAIVGYFELANRAALQARSLIVTANRVVVPLAAAANEDGERHLREVYLKSSSMVHTTSLVLGTGLILLIPALSFLYFSELNWQFCAIALLLSFTWAANAALSPPFFINLGSGNVHSNLKAQVIVALLNGTISVCLGLFISGTAVILGFSGSILAGSLFLITEFHRRHDMPLSTLFSADLRLCIKHSLVALAVGSAALGFFVLLPLSPVWSLLPLVLGLLPMVLGGRAALLRPMLLSKARGVEA